MSTKRTGPWVTRAVAAVMAPTLLVAPQIADHGFTQTCTELTGLEPLMSAGFFLLVWAITTLLAWLEVLAIWAPRPWSARGLAFTSIGVAALVGTLPVTFRLGSSRSPVEMCELEMATSSYLVMLLGYLAALVGWSIRRRYSAVRTRRAGEP